MEENENFSNENPNDLPLYFLSELNLFFPYALLEENSDVQNNEEEVGDKYPEELSDKNDEKGEMRKGHRKEETLVTMLELLSGKKDNLEVNELAINEQKEKAEQMINELQAKMQQITFEDPISPPSNYGEPEKENEHETSKKSSQKDSPLKILEQDIVGQYDFTLGKVENGISNLFCSEKLQVVQIPVNFVPKGTKTGTIVTISIARKKIEEDNRDKLILGIQNSILESIK